MVYFAGRRLSKRLMARLCLGGNARFCRLRGFLFYYFFSNWLGVFRHSWRDYVWLRRCGGCLHFCNQALNRCGYRLRLFMRGLFWLYLLFSLYWLQFLAKVSCKGLLFYIPGTAHLLAHDLLAADKLAHVVAMIAVFFRGAAR